ncbi:MAG: hypothetical protein J6A01_08540, partial [Proteobacteria bacterium]|nr:hypothetical protein [Pseudomonadota bacterium]
MDKRYLLTLCVLALIAGCDDGASAPGDPCGGCNPDQTCENGICVDDPCKACNSHEICDEGVCKPNPDDPCSKCDPDLEECINDKCEAKRPSDDPCTYCTEEQVCIEKECKPKGGDAECDPACGEGKTCVDGRCAICIGTNCFFESDDGNKFCDTDEECDENERCYEGECQSIDASLCDPACSDGQICVNGTCQSNTLLWSLCRSGSDCGVGECIFSITPSRTIRLDVNGEIVEYTTDQPIPVSLLDSRINPENYNLTHAAPAGDYDDIGICSYECTRKDSKICPIGWSCQVVAKGILEYPDVSLLPQDLDETEINESPFAALCRRDMDEDLQKDIAYGLELCNSDESRCNEAGMIFYNGMCLEPCETSPDRCPYFFSCESVDTASGSAMACVPNSGTCTECFDNDNDGAGYGHCTVKGIDCNDDDPNIYYDKPLVCSDFVDGSGTEIKTDFNCNGIIDKFELMGTMDNCGSCGNPCSKPQTSNITVSCDPVDTTDFDIDWRKTATMETEPPAFACTEKCSFGYGDCKGNASCDVALITTEARSAAKEAIANSQAVHIAAADVIIGEKQGKIYALDEDGDGYPTIDVTETQAPTKRENRRLILDSFNSVICCANDDKYCYSANQDWNSLPLNSLSNYVSPTRANSATSYDINDKAKEVNPKAVEACDGIDNDGSTLLSDNSEETKPCSVWCQELDEEKHLLHETECKDFSTTVNNVTTYTVNAYCDSTEDGSHDPDGWNDIVENKNYAYNNTCNRRSNSGDICNTGKVSCESEPVVSCAINEPNCGCAADKDHHAFRITAENTTDNGDGTFSYHPDNTDYVKAVISNGGDIEAFNCRCDGSRCTEGDCTDQDSLSCFKACSQSCTLQKNFALSCTVSDDDNTVDGLDKNGKPLLDGIDDDCDGRVDEDAMIPCVITKNAAFEILENGVKETDYYTTYLTAAQIKAYKLPQNVDGSVNLCRIGILQSEPGPIVDNKQTYIPKCVPLFKPRDYDFYGDAFDSNCDGLDYDINNTVFVSPENQGTYPGSDSNACKFQTFSTGSHVSPCATIQHALEVAAKKDSNKNIVFYDDILVQGSGFDMDTAVLEQDKLTNYGIKIPTLAKQSAQQKLYYYPSADLPDEDGHVKDGHILSPYKLHSLLVAAKRSKSTFDANKYFFSYWHYAKKDAIGPDGNAIVKYAYEPVTLQSEQAQPEEIIRIYGGLSRGDYPEFDLPQEYDLWQSGGENTKITWTPSMEKNTTKIYAFIQPVPGNPLSLKMTSMTINVSPSGKLIESQVDGATFIGINAMQGAKLLNLNNVQMTVTAPEGYSYNTEKYPGYPKSKKDPITQAPAGLDGGDSSRWENASGKDSGYVTKFNNNTCHSHSRTCGSGIDGTVAQNWGGCGGHSWTTKNYNTNNSLADDDGKRGNNGRKGAGATKNGGKAGTCNDMGGGSDWYCPKLKDHSSAQGQNGVGGAAGKNGNSDKTIQSMKFQIRTDTSPYSLYVFSDPLKAKGEYGIPGGGGGGGAVYQCWEGNGSNDTRCYAGDGGMGGCGGEGGLAGGTGGSAIGIAVRSTSTVEGSTRILLDGSKIITVNGSGGSPQPGAPGAKGGDGGYWLAYARCSGTAAVCSDTQDQGMGGGGS